MPNCPIHLHDLLVRLLELEDEARKELTQQAHSVAVVRVLERGKLSSGNKLSKKQQSFLKSVQEGRRRINEVYRSDQALWFAYQLQLSQAENDLAAPLVRDGKVVVKGKLRTRLTPLNLALRELVIVGIGIDERQIHEYLVQLNPIWGRGPDPSIARVIADLHEKGVTNTILRRLRREHPQIFKSEPFLRCGGRAGETARTLQDADKPRRREHSDRPVAQSRPANRLVELLVNLELAKLRRECTITTSAARRLLDDSTFRPEILRARFSDPKVAQRKDLTFSVSERRELRDFAGGEKGFPNLSVSDKVHAAMILGTGEVEKEILQREGEDYIERGGSIVDWHRHGDHPLDKYVLNRIEAKLSEIIEKPHGALHVFIIRTIEGRAAKHEDIRSALDRLVRVGFADEFLRDVWERYPIEAETRGLPTPSEAQPVESAARKPPSKTTDIRDIRLGVNIQNILVAQSLGSRPEQPSGESDPGTEDVSSPVAGGLEGGGHSRTGERAKKLGQQTTDGTGLASRLEYVFKMNGRVWDVRFGATEQGHFPDLKGFGIIRRLLLQPHPSMPISAVELMGGDSSRGAETYTKQPQLDNEAIEKHKERLREIPGEIDEANRREELEGVEKLEIEQDCIMGILGDALNIKGKSRPLGPASPEVKARKAVHELLERVYENMERAHPPLSDCVKHFRSGIGAKRTAYAYRPTKPLDWKL